MRGDKIELRVRGLGHVPSFKNNKMLTRGRLITDPQNQKWIERCIRDLESQLRFMYRTKRDVTETEPPRLCLTHWSNQFDDSVQWIPQISINTFRVPKGSEGATVILEEI